MPQSKLFFILFIAVLLTSCATAPKPNLTPLEIQSIQTREYQENRDIVFSSVISVFQDIGYTVQSVDKEIGFITAESAAKSDSNFLLQKKYVSQTKATAFIENISGLTKIRLNFVEVNTESSAYGQSGREDKPILDVDIYQNAFERIENAIFLRSNN